MCFKLSEHELTVNVWKLCDCTVCVGVKNASQIRINTKTEMVITGWIDWKKKSWLFTMLVFFLCSRYKQSNLKKSCRYWQSKNIAQTEEEQWAHLHSLPHEKCIILSPVASLCGESEEGSEGALLYRQQTDVSDGRIELVCLLLAGRQNPKYFTHQVELG